MSDNDEFERVFVYYKHQWYNRLKGKTYYRVFGNWKCNNCNHSWPSGYTWISFRMFLNGDDVSLMTNSEKRMYQKCSKCSSMHDSKLLSYSQLGERGAGLGAHVGGIHRRDLCEKCYSTHEYCA